MKGVGKKCFFPRAASQGYEQVLLLSTEDALGLVGHGTWLLEGCHEQKKLG